MPKETTEFEDALIKHGIIKDPNEGLKKEEQFVFNIQASEESDDSDCFFEDYKQKRFTSILEARSRNALEEIHRSDFVLKVTEESKKRPVIVLLHQSFIEKSVVLRDHLQSITHEYPSFSFVEIQADQCIPNYPNALVPTVIYYRHGKMVQQLTNIQPDQLSECLRVIKEDEQV